MEDRVEGRDGGVFGDFERVSPAGLRNGLVGWLIHCLFDELFVVDTGVESNEKSFERYSVQIFNKLLILFLKARFTVL